MNEYAELKAKKKRKCNDQGNTSSAFHSYIYCSHSELQGCHYSLYDGLMNRPLEEMIGRLLEVNPFAATQLLESKGLFMMPIGLAEGLPPQI